MKCRWCTGTGNRKNTGSCEHCKNSGQQTDPPFGGELQNVFNGHEVECFAQYWHNHVRLGLDLETFIQHIAQYTSYRTVKTEGLVCSWCSGEKGVHGFGMQWFPCVRCAETGIVGQHNGQLVEVLPESVVKIFAQYWNDSKRDENLGEFIQRVAQYVINIEERYVA